MLRMRGATPRGGGANRFAILHTLFCGEGKPLPTPPPPALRAARPLRCPRRKGISPRGKHPASRPPDKQAHLLPPFFGCGVLPPRAGVANRFAIRPTLSRGEGNPPHTLPGASRRKTPALSAPGRNLPEGKRFAPQVDAGRPSPSPASEARVGSCSGQDIRTRPERSRRRSHPARSTSGGVVEIPVVLVVEAALETP